MIKVIDIEMNNSNGWEANSVDDTSLTTYFECPIVNKLLAEGWIIKDWKLSTNDCIFIFEKADI